MNSMSLPSPGDELSITFQPKTFRSHLIARLVKWNKRDIIVNRLPSEIPETIKLSTVREVTVLSQAL